MSNASSVFSIEHIPAPALLVDGETERMRDCNAEARQLLGWTGPEEPNCDELLSPDDRIVLLRALKSPHGAERARMWKLRTADGFVSAAIAHRRLPDGHYLLVLHDVSSETRLSEALRESEERWARTAENVPGALFRYVMRPDGSDAVMYMSRGCVALWEIEPDSIVTDATQMWAMVHPEDVAAMQASVLASARDLTRWDHSWRITTPSGRAKWLRGIGQPQRADDGSIMWDSVILDLSEQRLAEQQLAAAQRLEAVGRLAGGVAHDFNNLLTVIISGVDEVLEVSQLSPGAREDLSHVLAAAGRAADLTRQLLMFARQQPLERGAVRLRTAVQTLYPLLARVVGARVTLEAEVHQSEWPVPLSEAEVDQVLSNLILNARAAMPVGGTIRVMLRDLPADAAAQRVVDMVELAVSDTGEGVTPEVQERMFEPFFTTKESDGGTGLGLATVYGLVTQAGGRISVSSVLGAGTTFTLLLPRATAENAKVRSEETEVPVGEGEIVLVVDDEPSILRVANSLLTELGYSVIVAASAAEALELAEERGGRFDLVLSDTVMPHLGGPELVAALRARWPALRVLLMSGYAPEGFGRAGIDPGEIRVLPKPFGREALARAVRRALDS